MKFLITWELSDTSEEAQEESLGLLSKWQPGPATFEAFYGFADGSGGFAIVEADSAATLARTMAPWTPWLDFQAQAILPIEETAAVGAEAIAFRKAHAP